MRRLKRKESGFTLIELMMALGLSGMAILILVGVQQMYAGQQKKLGDKIEADSDADIGRRVLLQDLKAIDPSFSNLLLKDNDGRAFFDYYPDISETALGGVTSRTLTLSLKGRKEAVFLVQDDLADPLPILIYDPVAAYNVGATPVDMNVAASITFNSLNKNNWITSQRPGFWRNLQLLMLDTPAMVRSSTTDTVDFKKVPRSPIYVGRVSGTQLVSDSQVMALVNLKDPQDKYGNDTVDSADDFLRNLPAQGGGQPLVRLKAVKLLKYSIEPMNAKAKKKKNGSNAGRLFKSIYENGRYTKKFALVENIETLTFSRNSVCEKVVFFSVKLASGE